MLFQSLSGLLLLRFADRQLFALLFQLPPRITRFEPLIVVGKMLRSQIANRQALAWLGFVGVNQMREHC